MTNRLFFADTFRIRNTGRLGIRVLIEGIYRYTPVWARAYSARQGSAALA